MDSENETNEMAIKTYRSVFFYDEIKYNIFPLHYSD